MERRIEIHEGELSAIFEIGPDGRVYLLHFAAVPFEETDILSYQKEKFLLAQLQAVGYDHGEHHGSKHTGNMPGGDLRCTGYEDTVNDVGRKLVFYQAAEGVFMENHIQFYRDIPTARFWNIVENRGDQELVLEYVASFALTGCGKEGLIPWDEKMVLYLPSNTWAGEAQWRKQTLRDMGLARVEGTAAVSDPQSMQNFSMKRVAVSSSGSWGCSEYLPMGILENQESGNVLAWQIEHHSAWHWEISDNLGQLYLQLSGPTGAEHQWYKRLKPGERFQSVKAAVAAGGHIDSVMGALTRYRRLIRRKNQDNERLPVIFNDYMNCLYGDPTTEKLLPLIDAAKEAGCEYFCIDAGWYGDGNWWDEVGEWMPAEQRFPKGIIEPLEYIRKSGMIPGLWLELEVMGVRCPLAERLPDSWFFQQAGKRSIDHGRYQLDYRNPEVREYASSVIERLVKEYGVGYIKMDYNINAGTGTDWNSDSLGDGLLEHCRAYEGWLEKILERYPGLVIENCSSGGMRMAYSLLRLCSIQSTSDQIDYKKYAAIGAGAVTAVTPEQAAVWAYPTAFGDEEETVFNMVNAMLFRIHQSGHLARLSGERFELVKEGIALYKEIRKDIKEGVPFWPLGFPVFEDEWVVYGMLAEKEQKAYLAVWHVRPGKERIIIPLERWKGKNIKAECLYPKKDFQKSRWNQVIGSLTVQLPNDTSARLFQISLNQ